MPFSSFCDSSIDCEQYLTRLLWRYCTQRHDSTEDGKEGDKALGSVVAYAFSFVTIDLLVREQAENENILMPSWAEYIPDVLQFLLVISIVIGPSVLSASSTMLFDSLTKTTNSMERKRRSSQPSKAFFDYHHLRWRYFHRGTRIRVNVTPRRTWNLRIGLCIGCETAFPTSSAPSLSYSIVPSKSATGSLLVHRKVR